MWVNIRYTVPWLNSVTLYEGKIWAEGNVWCFICPRVYAVIPMIHKVAYWEIQASCSLSACPWPLGWNERLSSRAHLSDNTGVYRDGTIKVLTALLPCTLPLFTEHSLYSPYTSQMALLIRLGRRFGMLLYVCGCLSEISLSLAKSPLQACFLHNVNSAEAFSYYLSGYF